MSDRRDPARQRPDPEKGERATDPTDGIWLNTAQCAAQLGVTPAFVVGEIRDGRLLARIVLRRPNKRTVYRIQQSDLDGYKREYDWSTRTAPTPSSERKR